MDEVDLESRDGIYSSDLALKCKAIGLISAKGVGENNNIHSPHSEIDDGACDVTTAKDSEQIDADSSDNKCISNEQSEAECEETEETGKNTDIVNKFVDVNESLTNTEQDEEKDERDSISLSTLISTIIKGTVANVDVGKNLAANQMMEKHIQTEVSTDGQQEKTLSDADNDSKESDSPRSNDQKEHSDGDDKPEVVEQSEVPRNAYHFRKGYGRRGRPQERFTMMRSRSSRLAHELPQMETINSEQGRFYRCVSCKVSFNFEQDMRMHLQTHLRPRYFCPVCSRRFLNQSTMERHMVTHDQNKPYVCTVCSQGFRIKSNLHRHFQRLHNKNGDKPTRRGRPRGTKSVSRSVNVLGEYEEENPNQQCEEPRLGESQVDEPPDPLSGAQSAPLENKEYQPMIAANSMPFNPPEPMSEITEIYRKPNHAAPTLIDPGILDQSERGVDFRFENEISGKRSSLKSIPDLNTLDQQKFFSLPTAAIDIDHFEPRRTTSISRVNGAAGENIDTRMLLSRYPNVDSAVDAIRRIETERLFHQELLIEELKLRKKYGLSVDGVLDHLRNEVSIQEKLGALDAHNPSRVHSTTKVQGHPLATSEDESDSFSDFPHRLPTIPLREARPIPQKRPIDYDPVFVDPLGQREDVQIGGRSTLTDPFFKPHDNSADLLPVSTHLREMVNQRMMSQYRPQPPEIGGSNHFNSYPPGPFRPPIRNDIPSRPGNVSRYRQSLPMPPSEWKMSHTPMTRPSNSLFEKPMRGRRRLASLPPISLSSLLPYSSAAPPIYPRSSPVSPLTSTSSPSTSHIVHHRPVIPKGPLQALPPPPLQYLPPIPATTHQHDPVKPFQSSSSPGQPSPTPTLPITPRGPAAKRQRENFQDHFIEEYSRYREADLSINPQAPPRLSPYLRALSPDRAMLPPFIGIKRGFVDREILDQGKTYGVPSTRTLVPNGNEPTVTEKSSNATDDPDPPQLVLTPSNSTLTIEKTSTNLTDDTPLDLSTKT